MIMYGIAVMFGDSIDQAIGMTLPYPNFPPPAISTSIIEKLQFNKAH